MKKAALIINAVGAGLAFVMMIYYGIILGIRMQNIAYCLCSWEYMAQLA